MRTRTHGGNNGMAQHDGSRGRRHFRPVRCPPRPTHPTTDICRSQGHSAVCKTVRRNVDRVIEHVTPHGEELDRVLYGPQCPATAVLARNGT
jgi:hypothetical protein